MIRIAVSILLAVAATQARAAPEAELLAKAQAGDYQAQRNLAFGYATGDQRKPRDAQNACAWYLLILRSDSPKLHVGDVGNVVVNCDRLDLDVRLTAERRANDLHRQIYGATKR